MGIEEFIEYVEPERREEFTAKYAGELEGLQRIPSAPRAANASRVIRNGEHAPTSKEQFAEFVREKFHRAW